jgi:DNA modification methylase
MPKTIKRRDETKYSLLAPLDPETYAGLKANIAVNGVQVPVVKDEDGYILDGFARAKIAKELGYECPSVTAEGLSEKEKRSQVRALNLSRRQLDYAAKRQIIADELKDNPDRSNRWLARSLGVHHASVIAVRNELTSTGHIDQLGGLVGRDGKIRSATGSIPSGETENLGISGHEPHYRGRTEEWLTPRFILDALGPFDLDPCAPINRPWDTARRHFTVAQGGLSRRWAGRVWLNPPYGPETQLWMKQMAIHANGIVLTFARTDTAWFSENVWGSASALYFLRGRVRFCTPDGEPSEGTGGAPSVLIAYDTPGTDRNREALRTCGLDGHFAPLFQTSSKGSTAYVAPMGDDDDVLQAAAEIRQRRVTAKLKELQEKRQQSHPVRIKKRGGPVLHGDCMDLIPTLEDGSVSLVVTSPPYAEQRAGHYEGVSEEDYPEFTVQWMSALAPKMTPDGSVFLVIRPHLRAGVLSDYVLRTRLALRETGWHECEELIWLKPGAPPLGSKLRPRRAWESILWFSRCGQPYADLKACGNESDSLGYTGSSKFAEGGISEKTGWHPCVESFGKGHGVARITDVIVANVCGNERGIDHPAMFPLALADQLIRTFSQTGDLVLDPFSGSGQSLLAAMLCGRRFLGIEREEKYVKIALGRLK